MFLFTKKKPIILAIDDSDKYLASHKKALCQKYEVITASDGLEGLGKLKEYGTKIQLIILDFQMPLLDGEEFLARRKSLDSKWAKIPVILCTSLEKRMVADILDEFQIDFLNKTKLDQIEQKVDQILT